MIGTAPATPDSGFPEYYDNYGQARPILYLRANKDMPGIVAATPKALTAQYNTAEFDYYKRGPAPTASDFPGDFNFGAGVVGDFEFYASASEYLRNPSSTTVPRGLNAFILISAGPDRCFGTRDDIFYGAN
jgi:hypothetical protein